MIDGFQKIIPLYKEIKPIITKITNLTTDLKNKFSTTNIKEKTVKYNNPSTTKKVDNKIYSIPQFFI